LPPRAKPHVITIGQDDAAAKTAQSAHDAEERHRPDVLIPFGSGRAIAHAQAARRSLRRRAKEQGKAAEAALDLFAIPGVDGLPSPTRNEADPAQALSGIGCHFKLPRIVICDPTVMEGVTAQEKASAAMDAFSRCVEAILSDAYNPTADGIAIDGLTRAQAIIESTATINACGAPRDLMAAMLNARLAQQKGVGPTQILVDTLREVHSEKLMPGALARVLLPVVLNRRAVPGDAEDRLLRVLNGRKDGGLQSEIEALLGDLPFGQSLSELGVTRADIEDASLHLNGSLDLAISGTPSGAKKIMELAL